MHRHGARAALGRSASASKRVRVTAPGPLADEVLYALPEVRAVEHHGPDIVVSGSGDLLTAVVLGLHSAGVRAEDTRPETASLEDAFLALTDETTDASTIKETAR